MKEQCSIKTRNFLKTKVVTNTHFASACLSLTTSSASSTCLFNSFSFSCFASIVSAPNNIVEIPFKEKPGGGGGGSSPYSRNKKGVFINYAK